MLGEVFDCVVHQKESSVIRGVLKLSILLNPATEGDPRVRLKYETTLEDIKTVFIIEDEVSPGQFCSVFSCRLTKRGQKNWSHRRRTGWTTKTSSIKGTAFLV